MTNTNESSNSSYSRAEKSQLTLNGDDSEGSRDVQDTSVFLRAMLAIDRSDTPYNRKAPSTLEFGIFKLVGAFLLEGVSDLSMANMALNKADVSGTSLLPSMSSPFKVS